MLALLAALVPIIASLYVVVSYLAEYSGQNHRARAFQRIDAWHREETRKLWALGLPSEDMSRRIRELHQRKAMLLEANGVDPAAGTRGMFSQMADPAPASPIDLRRQWVLLLGSVIGVLLLAVDALGSP